MEINWIFLKKELICYRWSIIAAQLPGRTDNDIKNYWNTKLKKKLLPPKSLPPFSFPQSQLYNSLYYSRNLTPISTPQNFLYYNNPDQGLMDLQYCSDNMLMSVARKEASCSSSDGSCSQISYSGSDQVKREEMGCYQGFMIDDQNTRSGINHHHQVDYNQLQYDESQLLQYHDLITAGNMCNTNVLSDENKREDLERGVMYYY